MIPLRGCILWSLNLVLYVFGHCIKHVIPLRGCILWSLNLVLYVFGHCIKHKIKVSNVCTCE